jgi:hypothetical protein
MQQSACGWLDVRAHAAGFSRNANQSAKLLAQHSDSECVVALSPVRPGATKPLSTGSTQGNECRAERAGPAGKATGRPCSPPCASVGSTAPNGLFNGLIWPEAGCASIAYAATAPIDFLPLPAAPSFLAKQESRLAAILRCASACEQVPRRSPPAC